jgi:hypothetical protein
VLHVIVKFAVLYRQHKLIILYLYLCYARLMQCIFSHCLHEVHLDYVLNVMCLYVFASEILCVFLITPITSSYSCYVALLCYDHYNLAVLHNG